MHKYFFFRKSGRWLKLEMLWKTRFPILHKRQRRGQFSFEDSGCHAKVGFCSGSGPSVVRHIEEDRDSACHPHHRPANTVARNQSKWKHFSNTKHTIPSPDQAASTQLLQRANSETLRMTNVFYFWILKGSINDVNFFIYLTRAE